MSFKRSIILLHIQYSYIYTWRNSPCFSLSLLVPFCSPFMSPFTYLAPSSCDRNRPPPSQVTCKLTLFAPPFTQLSHPFQIPRTPTAQRLTKTTSGIFRLLLSRTIPVQSLASHIHPQPTGLGLKCFIIGICDNVQTARISIVEGR
jgi:hypothetical protein